jgi:hypothetical protein
MNLAGEPGPLFFSHVLEARREGTQFGFFFTVRDVFECQQDEVAVERVSTNSASVQQLDCAIEISRVIFDRKIIERMILGKNYLQQPAQLGNIPLPLIELEEGTPFGQLRGNSNFR